MPIIAPRPCLYALLSALLRLHTNKMGDKKNESPAPKPTKPDENHRKRFRAALKTWCADESVGGDTVDERKRFFDALKASEKELVEAVGPDWLGSWYSSYVDEIAKRHPNDMTRKMVQQLNFNKAYRTAIRTEKNAMDYEFKSVGEAFAAMAGEGELPMMLREEGEAGPPLKPKFDAGVGAFGTLIDTLERIAGEGSRSSLDQEESNKLFGCIGDLDEWPELIEALQAFTGRCDHIDLTYQPVTLAQLLTDYARDPPMLQHMLKKSIEEDGKVLKSVETRFEDALDESQRQFTAMAKEMGQEVQELERGLSLQGLVAAPSRALEGVSLIVSAVRGQEHFSRKIQETQAQETARQELTGKQRRKKEQLKARIDVANKIDRLVTDFLVSKRDAVLPPMQAVTREKTNHLKDLAADGMREAKRLKLVVDGKPEDKA